MSKADYVAMGRAGRCPRPARLPAAGYRPPAAGLRITDPEAPSPLTGRHGVRPLQFFSSPSLAAGVGDSLLARGEGRVLPPER